ncbi:PadR family transcriptional regulator [Aquibacillus saliphilus]|uniref:PadR family transcriptional regulator n=1 Tax=Aquibacillus saliphilus TaxID=1909422 RepID=UPI001CEFE588|nr:PadR family transcriptional regulator [Aquibacillus saliphilus]
MPGSQPTPMTEAMYYVLLALSKPLHGYAVMDAVKQVSNNRVDMGPGTLYGILKRLQKEKLIVLEEADGRRKIYQISELGRQAWLNEYLRLKQMVLDGKLLFKEE